MRTPWRFKRLGARLNGAEGLKVKCSLLLVAQIEMHK